MPKLVSRPRITAGMLIFLSAFMIYSLSLNSVWATDHTTSFLQLDWAILVHHSFVVGSGSGFHPNTVDDFEFNGNYYSALAPGTAILALPFVGVGFMLDGHFTVFGYALILSELFVALANSIAAYLVYSVGRFFFSKKTSAFLAFAYAFATISWPFATYFFQSDVSAMFDLVSVYFVIRVTRSDDRKLRDAVFAGIAVAGALATDYVNVIFIPIIMGYLLFSLRGKGHLVRLSLGFLLASLVGISLIGLYNEAIFGTAIHTTEQVYLNSSTPLGEFSYPIYEGIYLNLISPLRGLLVFSIFLILGIFGYVDMLKQKKYRVEALFLLACFLGVFLPYSAWYDPTGGAAFGPRFLISAIPFLLLPAGLIIETGSRRVRATAFILYAAGAVINGMAGITSALAPTQNYGTFPFLSSTLPSFLSGGIDVWWLSYVHSYWPIPAILLIALAVMLPLISNHLLSRRGDQTGTASIPPMAREASDFA